MAACLLCPDPVIAAVEARGRGGVEAERGREERLRKKRAYGLAVDQPLSSEAAQQKDARVCALWMTQHTDDTTVQLSGRRCAAALVLCSVLCWLSALADLLCLCEPRLHDSITWPTNCSTAWDSLSDTIHVLSSNPTRGHGFSFLRLHLAGLFVCSSRLPTAYDR